MHGIHGSEGVVAAVRAAGVDLDPSRAPERLVGGASARGFWRAWQRDGQSCVAMVVPLAVGAAEHGAAAVLPEADRWFAMRERLEGLAIPVPGFIGRTSDPEAEVLVVEDLGDVRLYDLATAADERGLFSLYDDASALLARFQASTVALQAPSTLDARAMKAELGEFLRMGLEARHGISLTPAERAVVEGAFARIVDALSALPVRFAHRDFQSQNLMASPRGLVVIDFQDAFQAPSAYDWVALLRDSYVELPPPLLDACLAKATPEVRESFLLMTIQRKLKDAGRFVTLARRGKEGFLVHYPRTIRYAADALARTGLAPDLEEVLRARIPELRP